MGVMSMLNMSNVEANRHIKLVAAQAGVAHPCNVVLRMARTTFGQTRLDQGYSLEAVSAMLGHASISTTQRHYVRPSLERVSGEMVRQAA